MRIVFMLCEAALLASALSMDCFATGLAYGFRGTRVPFRSVLVISVICSAVLGLSLLAGTLLRPYLPDWLTVAAGFCILFFFGLIKLLDSVTKSIIRKHSDIQKQVHFSLFNFRFILRLYADPEAADVDQSSTLSPAEAAPLAVALSLDGMAVGFGAALGDVNSWAVVLWSLAAGAALFSLGGRIGRRFAKVLKYNISWLSGAILIVMALSKLFL